MSLNSVVIALQASRKDGRGVTTAEFLAPLAIQPGEVPSTRADGGPWASGMVRFAVIRDSDFQHVEASADARAFGSLSCRDRKRVPRRLRTFSTIDRPS